MPNNKVTCFVAMPFNRQDSDDLFDKLVFPLLKGDEFNIDPRCVDRLVYNDDIDKRIIKEIAEADFAIADLTYARPSVYFEAGYAMRSVPVIFTCREDHIEPQSVNPEQSNKVHFDLKMKNIITWKDSTDKKFIGKLRKRLKFVLKPILISKNKKETQVKASKEFQKLPLVERLSVIKNKASGRFIEAGFVGMFAEKFNPGCFIGEVKRSGRMDYSHLAESLLEQIKGFPQSWLGEKAVNGIWYRILFLPFQKITIQNLRGIKHWLSKPTVFNLNLNRFPFKIQKIIECCVCPCFNSVSNSTMQTVFDQYEFDQGKNCLSWSYNEKIPICEGWDLGSTYWDHSRFGPKQFFTYNKTQKKMYQFSYETSPLSWLRRDNIEWHRGGDSHDKRYQFNDPSEMFLAIPKQQKIFIIDKCSSPIDFIEKLDARVIPEN